MKRSILFILLAGFLFTQCSQKTTAPIVTTTQTKETFRSQVPEAGPARKIRMGTYSTFDLDNGLKVIVVENHKLPIVSYQLSLRNEAFKEGDQAGYVSFTGQLLNKGTKNRTKAEIDEAVDFIGASFNTSGSGFFASSLSKHQETLLDVVSDVLYNPTFPEEEFDKIKKQTLSGLAQSKTDPNSMASNVSSVLRYGKDHPYGEIQTEETVNNITIDKCKEFYQTYFRPNNAYLTIVGDITPETAKTLANAYFGKWKSKPIKPQIWAEVDGPSDRKVAFVHKDGAVQSVIRVTYPVSLKPGASDGVAASVMNSILGGGIFSGRLMQNLREDKAYTYGARSSLSNDAIVGNFNAFASVRNEVTDSSVTEFLYEMKRMRDERVSQEDLDLVKSSMAGGFARSLESPQTVARFALNTVRYNLPSDYYETYLERLDAVTIDDVHAAAMKYIRPENAYVVVVGDKETVAPKLADFASSGKVAFYDAEGEEVVESDVAVPDGITAETVIKDYLNAIGGKDKLDGVKAMQMRMSMDMMGQAVSIEMYKKAPNKMYTKVGSGGMVFNEQKYDGSKLQVSGMGQNQVLTEGDEVEDAKAQSAMFSQIEYLKDGYTIELKGVEDVDGANCYKVEVVDARGNKSYEYYNIENSLLTKQTSTREAQGQTMTVTNVYKDYKAVDGVLLPYSMTVSGMMPMPAEMKLEEVKINPVLSDDLFMVE